MGQGYTKSVDFNDCVFFGPGNMRKYMPDTKLLVHCIVGALSLFVIEDLIICYFCDNWTLRMYKHGKDR